MRKTAISMLAILGLITVSVSVGFTQTQPLQEIWTTPGVNQTPAAGQRAGTTAARQTAPQTTPARVTAKLPGGKAKDIPTGPYQPTWESIKQNYQVPTWFKDAKFGIFLHWGVYSVAGKQSEWYPKHMYNTKSVAAWHAQNFGPQDQFGYKDMIPLFTCQKFNPDEWAALFKESGAQYIVPTAEHHDGFAMYDSDLTEWCAAKMGPKRDLIGDLAKAVRKQGLKFGVSNHRMENWSFMYPTIDSIKTDLFDPKYAGLYGPPQPPRTRESKEFLEEWLARCQELVDKYHPDMMWFDNGLNGRSYDDVKMRLAAYYYNSAKKWGKEVSISTKSTAYLAGSILDFERGHPQTIKDEPWQTDNTVHTRWGYLRDAVYRTTGPLVRELVDNVSKNGNLLLNFSPKPDGTIPDEQIALLKGIGKWLKLNGEAIYGTRVWTTYGEGPSVPTTLLSPREDQARIQREAVGDLPEPVYTGKDFRFTTKGNTLYAIALAWPGRTATITSLASGKGLTGKITAVTLLGSGPVKFTQDGNGLHLVELPYIPPCDHAFVFKITGLSLTK